MADPNAHELKPTAEAPDDERGQTPVDRWLEPFYDLVAGVLIGQLTTMFTKTVTLANYGQYCAVFVPSWWLWNGFSMYFDRFDRNSRWQQGGLLLSMVLLVLLAVTAPQTLEGKVAGFTWCYVAARGLLLGLYAYTYWTDEKARPLARGLLTGYSLGWLGWVIGGLWPTYGLWWKLGGLLIDLITPRLNQRLAKQFPATQEHFTSRLREFTMIVVSQNIEVLPRDLGDLLWQGPALITSASGFVLGVGLWWWYYQHHTKLLVRKEHQSGLRYALGHLPVYLGSGTVALGVFDVLHGNPTVWLLPLGLTLYTVSLLWLGYPQLPPECQRRYRRNTALVVAAGWGIILVPMASWLSLVVTNMAALGYVYFTYPVLVASEKDSPSEAEESQGN
ncbi:low temperature requirement protein A [uncultured Hymenobacter sp.]|uniref:low temperature requirement protein A n=1 Tax=uncultured Hymenobacter sp. TaxID=170016 RepID=UPI0035CB615A